jgi:organic radical activating enzyme
METVKGFDGMGPRRMRLEEVEKVLDFLQRSQCKVFSIIGGEPTTHPDFQQIVRLGLKNGFAVLLFTNGICRKDIVPFLADLPDERVGILVNTNKPESYSAQEWERLQAAVRAWGPKASLSFNIFEPDFDLQPLADLIQASGCKKLIRLGLAQPILKKQNDFVPVDAYPAAAERLVEQAEQCYAQGVRVGFDCGFTRCMFTHEHIGRLYDVQADISFDCQPVLDIGPGLECWSCFPLSSWERVNITDFQSVDELRSFFSEKQKLYSRSGMLADCFSCNHRAHEHCKGGCLSHVISSYE